VPIVCLQTNVLQCWITARLGYPYPGHRHEIEQVVRAMLREKIKILEPEKVPIQIGQWQVHEILQPTNPNVDCNFESYFSEIRRMNVVGDAVFDSFYSRDADNFERAFLLVQSGSVVVGSICFKDCEALTDARPVTLFRLTVVPSMKSTVISANEALEATAKQGYLVYLCYDSNTKDPLPYPFSCCGCYDGRGFCSHLLATLSVFRLVQKFTDQRTFENTMPPSPIDLTPILIEGITIKEYMKRNKKLVV
jgi:hypothetical protein